MNDLDIIDISCGAIHTLVLIWSGQIYSWSDNQYGKTGNASDNEYQLIPFKMNSLVTEKFKAISSGGFHWLALKEDGRVFGCGLDLNLIN